MILQELLFPCTDTCMNTKMYYNAERVTTSVEDSYCVIPEGEKLCANTYFNCFSIGKWNKYTIIDNLNLKLIVEGTFLVRIHHAYKMMNTVKNILVDEKIITATKDVPVVIPISVAENKGVYFFTLKSLSGNGMYWGGAYETTVDEDALERVRLAVGICTFRREEYIAHNIDILNRYILKNEQSALYQNLEIFISDNSQTLRNIDCENVHVFPNRNLGGAGGFTRTMVEINKVKNEKKFTHFLLMDDDIRLNPDSLLRTYTFLRLLKPEYREAFIGGHMLKIDAQHIQSEAADHWDIVTHHPVKYNYNLEKLNFIIKNEIEDSVNYLSWWYCCMPIGILNDNNLPLPVFIKRDDIEYGLRNGKQFITLNGICVWHEPFSYKSSAYLEYYYFRNMCIMNSRHRLSCSEKRLIKAMTQRIRDFLLRYRYKEAELSLLGIQHYLNGIDWLKAQDGEYLNAQILKMGYQKTRVDALDYVFTHGAYEQELKVNESKKQKWKRKLTLNGWLLPAKRDTIIPAYLPNIALFYRARKVFNYEEASNSGFFTEKSYSSLFTILKMYVQTVQMIKKKYKQVTLEYRDRYDELTNIKFWNHYLFEEGEKTELHSRLDVVKRPKNTKVQYKRLFLSYTLRFLQLLLFWLPVKKNRVMIYVHDRKGFTCNPKYVVKKLTEMYGDKLEIIWSTMHPETCQELEQYGVKVIKSGSPEQLLKYLRTRFFITNDSFPFWALHRHNQKWINTWHGAMNYKHIGYDYLAPMSPVGAKLFKIQNRTPDFFISGSEFFTKDTAKSFRFKEDIFLSCGLPRNDVLFEKRTACDQKVREFYGIDKNKKLVMFAPTFRRGMKSDTYGLDFNAVCNALHERFGGEWVMLFRNHNFVKGKQKYNGAIDVSAYHDMQELLCAADVLISDYSSCLYDFSLTKRPAFVYAPDLDQYVNSDRSFAYPFAKWPYPSAQTNAELSDKIVRFDEQSYKTDVSAHLRDVGKYDNGTASAQVAELIAKYCL